MYRIKLFPDKKNICVVKYNIEYFHYFKTKYSFEEIFSLAQTIRDCLVQQEEVISIESSMKSEIIFMIETAGAAKTIKKINKLIKNTPVYINGEKILLNGTFGLSFTRHIQTQNEFKKLLYYSEIALVHAREKRLLFAFYSEKMEKQREKIEKDMSAYYRFCKEESILIPYFQPIVCNRCEELVSYESLARLKSKHEVLVPFEFLDIVIKMKDSAKIIEAMFTKTFNIFDETKTRFSLNMSPRDIEDRKTRTFVLNKIKSKPEISKRLTIEILEIDDFINLSVVKKFIKEVRGLGVRVAIDDFGVGYSNFSRAVELDIDYLKIDASLVKNIENEKSKLIISLIVDFAKKINCKTIAEYVESYRVFCILKDMGVDYSQGYYFGRPEEKPQAIMQNFYQKLA